MVGHNQPYELYSQEHFPSLDYTITFHVGLSMRMSAQQVGHGPEEQRDRLASVWRRWSQAAHELDLADEAEQFQAVGMRCREALLALTAASRAPDMVPTGREAPKAGDFIGWAELIAETIAPGASNKGASQLPQVDCSRELAACQPRHARAERRALRWSRSPSRQRRAR